ncbi:ATP-binding cassette sub-family C member Sur [Phlebotomus argentipes]|uniref:ATP-binding cassette sub-family C member Sur n=1 Tax=Phlebotomus argentipes TaxID=94469 RepID=UPI0028932566|nr:ATP-binding cassette sub-family C member Sur [Phlebotomus argentipes]
MMCSTILLLLLTLLDSIVTYREMKNFISILWVEFHHGKGVKFPYRNPMKWREMILHREYSHPELSNDFNKSQSGRNRTINWSECIGYKHPQLTFLSRVTFWWLTPLLWRGWWKPLEPEDLGNLSEEDTCRYHYDKFLLNCRSSASRSLWRAYMRTYWRETALGGALRLLSDAMTLVGPLGISLVVEYVAHDQSLAAQSAANATAHVSVSDDIHFVTWRDLVTNGWFVAVVLLLASLAQGTLSQSSTHVISMVGIHLKAAIQGLIYRKTLSLSPACFRHADSTAAPDPEEHAADGEAHSETDAGSITNLMTEDAENIMSFFWIIHYVWSIPLKISIVIYLLYLKLGWSAVFGSLICVALMTPLQFIIGKMMSKNAEKMSQYTDERLNKLNEILLGIRIIKLNAWVESFKERLHACREKELRPMKLDCVYWTALTFLTHVASILIAFVTLAIATGYEGDFSSSRVFSALALFNQLTIALFIFPITVPITISAIISTRRLETFMAMPDVHKEVDGSQNVARVLSRGDNLLDIYENEDLSDTDAPDNGAHVTECPAAGGAPGPTSGHRGKSKLRKSSLSLYSQLERNRERRKAPGKDSTAPAEQPPSISDSTVLRITNGVFTWNKNHLNAINLAIEHLQVNKGALVMVVGPSGSGKSSLLAALLREIHLISGSLAWNRFATVAYVSQTSWVLNTSIRDNILFGESFRPKRYDKVVEACALKPDIELMPEQDSTIIGEQGINLSGGQRQRIAIARALYSSANVVIMDDPFSALDHEVTKFVFENGIKKMLIRHKRTTILVTQNLQLIRGADMIIAMENHRARIVGALSDIMRDDAELYEVWQKSWSSQDRVSSSGKTARERWKLFKNVAKLGLQKVNSDDGEVTMRKLSYLPSKSRSSIYGSSLLAHDIPLPIDECYGEEVQIRRRPSRWMSRERAGMLRIKSLQSEPSSKSRNPVSRNISSPTRLQSENPVTEGDECSTSKFYNLFRRLSSRRSARNAMLATPEEEFTPGNRLSSRHCRKASTSNSIQSIEEEEEEAELAVECSESSGNVANYEEERKYGEIPVRIYWQYLKDCGLGVVALFCLIALSWQTLRVLTDVWLQSWTNTIDLTAQADTRHYFNIYAILSGGCVLLSMLSTPIGQYAGLRARRKIHAKLLDAILGNSLRFFQTTPLGRIMNRFSNDMAIIDKKIAPTSQRLLQFLLLCLCSILINSFISPWFLLLSLPICAIYYGVQHFYRSSSRLWCDPRELQRIVNIMSSPILSHFTETIQGVATIRAYNQEARFMEILFRRMEANNVAFVILNTSNRWLGIALDYLGGIIVFLAIVTALFTAHIYAETTLPSMVGLAINYTLLVPIYLNWVVKLLADMEMYVGAVERIEYYIKSGSRECTDVYKPVPISWPQRGDIVFENVSCRYGSLGQDIIANLSLKIPAGQRIGICGRSGSGKSSLALALFGALTTSGGRILIDDVSIAEIHVDELRSRLSIIPQDVVLFRGTVRDNLDPRGHFSDMQCWNCLEMAQIKQLIQANPAGLDAQVEENGSNYSVGQRQLFCLARAVLRGSVCLILDEATSALDPFTERTLLQAANDAFHGRTIIMITHRLATLLTYDRVIVLEAGRVAEEGCPKVLKETRGSKFASMLQSSYHEST